VRATKAAQGIYDMTQIFEDRGFRIHALTYAAVNILLLVINLATSPDDLWFYWPLLGWGIGLTGHAYAVHRRLEGPMRRPPQSPGR
jgi:hypothetical protein